jgi:hypothetical protein
MSTAAAILADLRKARRELKFNPNHGDHGRFSSGGGGGGGSSSSSPSTGPGATGEAAGRRTVRARIATAAKKTLWAIAGVGSAAVAGAAAGALRGSYIGHQLGAVAGPAGQGTGMVIGGSVGAVGGALVGTAAGATLLAGAVTAKLGAKGVRAVSRALSRARAGKSNAGDDIGAQIATLSEQERGRFLLALIGDLSDDEAQEVADHHAENGGGKSLTLLAELQALRLELKQFNSGQSRDDHGRFSSAGGGGASAAGSSQTRRQSGRVPKNAIRATAHFLQRSDVHTALAGLGLSLAPSALSFTLGLLAEHADNEQLHDTVHRAVSSLATRLGAAFEVAKAVLRKAVDALINLARSKPAAPAPAAAASRPASAARPAARMPRGPNIEAPPIRVRRTAPPRELGDHLSLYARNAELALKADDGADMDILPVLIAMRDAIDASKPA